MSNRQSDAAKQKKAGGGAVFAAPLETVRNFLDRRLFKRDRAKFLYLEVTHRCNLKCIACYTGAGAEKEDALTLEEQKSVIRQAKDMGVRTVSLSGSGEPLLYPRLFELIEYIREQGMTVVVFTNGTLLDEMTAAFLIRCRVITYFKLYSFDPSVFDRMVGRPNAYQWVEYRYAAEGIQRVRKIPSGLKCLLDARQNCDDANLVKAETLITKINLKTIPDAAQFCKEVSMGFYLETIVFKGRAIRNYHEVAVSGPEYKWLYEKLEAIWGRDYLESARNASCSVEKNPVVWTNGQIGLCSSRSSDIGNVRDQSLRTLFLKAKRLKRKEDRKIAACAGRSCYFRTCPSRQSCEKRHNLPCDY